MSKPIKKVRKGKRKAWMVVNKDVFLEDDYISNIYFGTVYFDKRKAKMEVMDSRPSCFGPETKMIEIEISYKIKGK